MGQSRSKAQAEAKAVSDDMNTLMELMESRLRLYTAEFERSLGKGYTTEKSEVGGGRRVRMQSEVRVETGGGTSSGILDAIGSFLDAASEGVAGENDKAKHSAIAGVHKAIIASADAIMGANEAQGVERKGFFNLFLYNAFVRVDFAMYSYCASGEKWGAKSSESAACYVAQLAVLDASTLTDDETTYMLSEGLQIPITKYARLSRVKDYLRLHAMGRKEAREKQNLEEAKTVLSALVEVADKLDTLIKSLLDQDSIGDKILEELIDKEKKDPNKTEQNSKTKDGGDSENSKTKDGGDSEKGPE
ncbi:hypothetical protein DIPPA_26696 [Diplonema papillatum]|nr:hypothetical protein DIPPA_26696 [Diplonema papillatum]